MWFEFLLAAVRAQAGSGMPFSLGAARAVFGAWGYCVLGMGASSKEDKPEGTLECKVHGTGLDTAIHSYKRAGIIFSSGMDRA